MKEVGDVVGGFKTALNQTGETAMNIVGKTGLDRLPGWQRSAAETHANASRPLDTAGGKAGAVIENIIEFAAGDELLKGATILTKMNELRPFAEALKKSPMLTRILGNAIRTSAVSGGQTAVHGGSAEDALVSAAVGGAGSAALEGVPAAVRAGREALHGMRPTSLNIAGGEFPVLAKGKGLNLPPVEEVAVDPASAAVDASTKTLGQRAVARSLTRSNAARPTPMPRITDEARMLEAPEGSASGMRVQGGPTTEAREGELLQPARKKQIGTEVREGKGPGKFDVERYNTGEEPPPTGEGELTQRGSHREPKFQYLTSTKPGSPAAAADVTTGPGALILTADGKAASVGRARAQLSQYERILDDPAILEEMGVRQHQQIVEAHADLQDQLRRYDDYAASEAHFPEHQVADVLANTHDLGTAGQQIMDAHRPFWQRADALSNNEFTALDKQRKGLLRAIRSDSSTASRLDKIDDLKNVTDDMDALFDKHRANFSPEEWQTAKNGYREGATLQELHNIFEAGFDGNTKEDALLRPAKAGQSGGLKRVFDPSKRMNSSLEDLYQKRGDVLEKTIGKDGMLDLKEITQLFQNSQRRGATKSLMNNISSSIRRHGWAVGGLAGLGAYGPEHAIGTALGAFGLGTAAEGTVSGTAKTIVDRLTTDPDFAKRFIYAAKNDVSPRIAGPLLANMLIRGSSAAMAQSAREDEDARKKEPPPEQAPKEED